jgi:hypothetical protein
MDVQPPLPQWHGLEAASEAVSMLKLSTLQPSTTGSPFLAHDFFNKPPIF